MQLKEGKLALPREKADPSIQRAPFYKSISRV
jgi:hypothetical protein